MNQITLVLIALVVVALITVGLSYIAAKEKKKRFKETGKHPKGHYLYIGLALGMILGMIFGVALGNPGFGPGLGLIFGVALGLALEEKYKRNLRPMTKAERKQMKFAVFVGVILALAGVGTALIYLFYYGF